MGNTTRTALSWRSTGRRLSDLGKLGRTPFRSSAVFLVDDHEVVRRGLIDLLSADPELDVVGEAGSVSQALARIPALEPDVAVLDVRLPDGNGIELCRDLLSRLPNLRCLMLTSFTSDEAMLDAIWPAPAATSSRTSRAWAPAARCSTTGRPRH